MPPSARAWQHAADVVGVDADGLSAPTGYLDLIGDDPPPTGIAQRLMTSRAVPAIYERWWRPALARLAKGPGGPSMSQELSLARRLLATADGQTVVDVACGTGAFTRALGDDVGEAGVAIGLDASATMLARAVAGTRSDNVVFVRADVTELELAPGRVDAVGCFAALHLFADPWAALDTMAGALVPGGRLAVLTTAQPARGWAATLARIVCRACGLRLFSVGELAAALDARGCEVTTQRRFGLFQLIGAHRRPGQR